MDKKLTLNYCKETISFKKNLESGFLLLAERLAKIRNGLLWQQEGWSSFPEFLHEMSITEATASRLISVYDKFVVQYQLEDDVLSKVGWSSLYSIGTSTSSKKEAQELIDKALVMSATDLRDEIREKKLGHECKHEETYTLTVCSGCGKKWRDHDNNEE